MAGADNQQPDREQVAAQVRATIQGKGLRQATVAREAGVSSSALSTWLQGKYAGDDDAITAKLAGWLENLRRRDSLPTRLFGGGVFVRTPTAGHVLGALEYAQLTADVTLIAGEPGLGKTRALEHYAETRPSAWLATMSPDTGTLVPMLEEIGLAIGLRQLGGGAARMRRSIVERVRSTGGILMVDECQNLSLQALETLRRIHDTGHVALALSGDVSLREKLSRYAQLFGRISKTVILTGPEPGDAADLATAFGIESDAEREFLARAAMTGGGVRKVVKAIRLGFLYADGGTPTMDTLKVAWANVGEGGSA